MVVKKFYQLQFYILDFLYLYTGNFGVAILLLTVLIKLVFFPVVNRSYVQILKDEWDTFKDTFGDQVACLQESQNLVKGCLAMFFKAWLFGMSKVWNQRQHGP